ncbi:hypothetical protein EBZ39_15245, partial [bacterium]|nr:hypothetical protein [bacterium]
MKNIRNIMALLAGVVGLMGAGSVQAAGRVQNNPYSFGAAAPQQSSHVLQEFLYALVTTPPLPPPNAVDSAFNAQQIDIFRRKIIANTALKGHLETWFYRASNDSNVEDIRSIRTGPPEAEVVTEVTNVPALCHRVQVVLTSYSKILGDPEVLSEALIADASSNAKLETVQAHHQWIGLNNSDKQLEMLLAVDEAKLIQMELDAREQAAKLGKSREAFAAGGKKIEEVWRVHNAFWKCLQKAVEIQDAKKKSAERWTARKKFAINCLIGAAVLTSAVLAVKYRSGLKNAGYSIIRWFTPLGVAETAGKVGEFYHPHHAPATPV